jgi:hypothetical protein
MRARGVAALITPTTDPGREEPDVSDGGDGTTFMQWRERAQSEVREDRPTLRIGLILGVVVVVLAIVAVAVVLLLS